MKRLAICISLLLTLAVPAFGAQRKIAFERGDNVWIANFDGSDAKKIAAGSLPNISPDATRLGFNTSEDKARSRTSHCHHRSCERQSHSPQRHSRRQLLWPGLVAGRK